MKISKRLVNSSFSVALEGPYDRKFALWAPRGRNNLFGILVTVVVLSKYLIMQHGQFLWLQLFRMLGSLLGFWPFYWRTRYLKRIFQDFVPGTTYKGECYESMTIRSWVTKMPTLVLLAIFSDPIFTLSWSFSLLASEKDNEKHHDSFVTCQMWWWYW